ncbi:MAG: putative toxin-antitoxin system toxin component, PIN family [Anaerolineales bacterium]|nr:putative toxin-antitoxin system toxin component, PIN family [Anaerolineales bacterium]
MRVVADTNTIISGLFWRGAPRQVLDAAREGRVDLVTSATLLAELEDVLTRAKFTERLRDAGVTAAELVLGYAALAKVIESGALAATVSDDPDDDAVLACAAAAQADAIVSGDKHLLKLKQFQDIPVLTAIALLERLPADSN